MKINWGTYLVAGALMFMGFIIYLAIKINQTDVPLVEENYYEKGLNYQQIIDNSNKTNNLLFIDADKNGIIFKSISGEPITGTALFYRPSNKNLDFSIPVNLLDTVAFIYPTIQLPSGSWKVTFKGKHMSDELIKTYEFRL